MKHRVGGDIAEGTASGLRPASAFVLIGVVLLAVTGKAAHLAFVAPGDQPDPLAVVTAPWPGFEVTDRGGRPLAVSVECFDLTASPRSLWRSHTPDRIANALAAVLGDEAGRDILALLLPAPPAGEPLGLVRVSSPRLLRFDLEAARAVDHWLLTGGLDDDGAGPIDGIWLAPLGDGTYTLEWAPAVALRQAARLRHLGEDYKKRPDLWTRRLLRNLSKLVRAAHPDGLPAEVAEALAGLTTSGERRELLADGIWAELMPTTFRVVRRKVEPVVGHSLHELLEEELISPWQMQLVPRLDRRHPTRPAHTQPVAARGANSDEPGPPVTREDAFAILGHWGVLGTEEALERARFERDRSPQRLEWSGWEDPVERRAWQLETDWRPWSGLELLCSTELASPRWAQVLANGPRSYTRRTRSVARDRRGRWEDKRVPDYFQSATDGLEVPRCETTLDAELQQLLHTEMLGLLREFKAAVAQAIVIDVATGDVLAVDGAYAYDISGFAPIRHVFTPGSTHKAIVMAIALDQGVVRPDDLFETFAPRGIVVRDGRSSRAIREALGAPSEALISATQGLAHSVNAVLVQVGLKIPAPILRAKLLELGYGARPGAGLGPESAGHVPPLDRHGTWSRVNTHASVSFGHELGVTLWQHAQALATVARGGVFRPLRLLRAVEQEGERWELPLAGGERVLSAQACDEVRTMMAVGAREGTGDRVASPAHCPEFSYVGTKTGTTEKVSTEVSLHVEWPRQLELAAQGRPWNVDEYRALIGKRHNLGIRNTCYTSSMAAVGRVGDRELLTMVIVDEPRSRRKFGADVAGKATMRILRQAHGLSAEVDAAPAVQLAPGRVAFNDQDLPWAEEAGR
jgi:cell division protein FtsI/penicillin-binding protein 2